MGERGESQLQASDADLVSAALGGDAASLGALLERYRAPLHALAVRLLGYTPDAEDAVHDAFLIALCSLGSLRAPDAAGAWLHGIVRNVCLRKLRAPRAARRGAGRPDSGAPR
jgi:RNA polymerase sigma-70 factor (ECF subfamily)